MGSCLNVKATVVKISGSIKSAWIKKIFLKNGTARTVKKIKTKIKEVEFDNLTKMMFHKTINQQIFNKHDKFSLLFRQPGKYIQKIYFIVLGQVM